MSTNPLPRDSRARGVLDGTLRIHPRGFGFIETGDGRDDTFVPGTRLGGLLDGDRVEARTRRGRNDDDRVVVSIRRLDRSRTSVLGEVVEPGSVRIDPGVSVDTVPVDTGAAVRGELVRIAPDESGDWQVVESLGPSLDDDGLARRFFDRYQLPIGHSTDVEAAGTALARAVDGRRPRGRRDPQRMRIEHCTFTIDEDHSADLDDALSVIVDEDDTLRVLVHIADVTEHVTVGSTIDRAAAAVPTSVYLPQLVRHMLPSSVGADALSLLPGVERDTVTVELRIGTDGSVTATDVYESTITSTCRLDYRSVERCIDGDRTGVEIRGGDVGGSVADAVLLLWTAACRLSVARTARGGVSMTGEDEQHPKAHQLVERLMVAANEAVAEWLLERGMPALFRNHPGFDAKGRAALADALAALGLARVVPESLTPAGFCAIEAQVPVAGRPVFDEAVFAGLGRARYDVANDGHFGLGSRGYVHFTSPLRRYADMCVHRIVKRYLAGERQLDEREVAPFVDTINDVTRRAAWAERDAVKARTLRSIEPGDSVQGRVRCVGDDAVKLDVQGVLVTVRLRDLPVEATSVVVGATLPLVVTAACPFRGSLEVRHPLAPASTRRRRANAGPAVAGERRPPAARPTDTSGRHRSDGGASTRTGKQASSRRRGSRGGRGRTASSPEPTS